MRVVRRLLALMTRMDVMGIVPRVFFDRYGSAMDLIALLIVEALPGALFMACTAPTRR